MNKNGFTLIELIGSIVILALIALVAFPSIVSVLNKEQGKMDSAVRDRIISAVSEYVYDNADDFPKQLEGNSSIRSNDNVSYQKLVDNGYIDKSVGDKTCEVKNDYVKVSSDTKRYYFDYVEVSDSNC